MKRINRFVLISVVLLLTLALTGCGKPKEASKEGNVTVVRVGIVGEITEPWGPVREILEKENIEIELIKFADYSIPNQALQDKEIDLNAFQHVAFLDNEIKERGFDLTPIGTTLIAPLNIYSDKISNIDEIKQNDKIAIPNDVTNGGRALKVLESAGLIEVRKEAGYVPEISDIISNPLELEIMEVAAAQIPSLLPDVAAAIINGNHAYDYGLKTEDAIYTQDVSQIEADNPYINVIVARTEDVNNEIYKKVVEAYNTDATAQAIIDAYGGLYLPIWFTD